MSIIVIQISKSYAYKSNSLGVGLSSYFSYIIAFNILNQILDKKNRNKD